MTNGLALYTTVYPGVERYLAPWWSSVRAQTDRAFDLWVGLDGVSPNAFYAAIGDTPAATWTIAQRGDSPAAIRQRAMEGLVDRYDAVVFTDSDDILEPTRVAAARAALSSYDVSACALEIIDEAGRDVGCVFAPPEGVDAAEILPRYNVWGLSNSAFRSTMLRRCLPVPRECVLFDWALAARAWGLGARMCFERTPRMRYRQHGANTARVLPPFTAEQVMRATEHVLVFYRCMNEWEATVPGWFRERFAAAAARAAMFHTAMTRDAGVRTRYIERLNRLTPQYVWWWCVAHPDLEDVWSH